MEFYLSFSELFSKFPNTIILVFVPIFIFTILAEALVIQARHGDYSWKNTGVSTLVAVGHVLAQAATHGIIFGIIAAGVYAVRLTTIPVSFHNWPSLIALFLLTDLAFYVEHRCSHRIRLMWASHSVHAVRTYLSPRKALSLPGFGEGGRATARSGGVRERSEQGKKSPTLPSPKTGREIRAEAPC
jgi:sterol desaturase/sphingolipid hydroxylase (fatty acid hydroxylase superfamily)